MKYDIETLRGDLFGGLTSAVVALPVALAFGIASGLGAAAGLYGAIAVGLFGGLPGAVGDTLDTLNILRRVPGDRIVATLGESREIAARLLEGRAD